MKSEQNHEHIFQQYKGMLQVYPSGILILILMIKTPPKSSHSFHGDFILLELIGQKIDFLLSSSMRISIAVVTQSALICRLFSDFSNSVHIRA